MTKSKLFILSMCLFAALCLQAQEKMPQAISYQAVARDAQGKVIAAQTIGVKVEILKGSASGEVVFSETHNPTSSRTGTVNLLIGQGSPVTGEFAAIDWGGDTYYLQLSMDVAGGSNYQLVSTTQMLPVPYALYVAKAGSAETVENGGNSGGEESSSDMPKFTFVVTDINNTGDSLYEILAGNLHTAYDHHIHLEFTILYLDGRDQQLDVDIEGLSAYDKELGTSCCMGRQFDIHYTNVPKGNYNLRVIDKDGNIVKKYPFTIVND